MRLFLILVLVSLNALAVEWPDLIVKKTYSIQQKIILPIAGSHQYKFEILTGEKFYLKQIYSLTAGVVLYSFEAKNCPGMETRTEMEIIPVQQTSPVVEIGVQLERECELNVFIEGHDLWTQSIFEE